jgi:hypothetical protein
MFEQLRNSMETDAMVKFKNGKSLYGIIIDFIGDERMKESLRFVPNHSLELYRATENPQFVMTLSTDSVSAVDVCLK